MRKIISITILFFIPLLVISQKIVLPKGGINYLFEINGMKEIGEINLPITKEIIISEDGIIFCLDTSFNSIILIDSNLKNYDSSRKIINIPTGMNPYCIEQKNNTLFLGGENQDEKIYFTNINKIEWKSLEIPDYINKKGKAIDDLLISGDTLFALDNIVMPKYLLSYNLNDIKNPILNSSFELPSNGPYESMKKIIFRDSLLFILSSTFSGWHGSSEHITVLKSEYLLRYEYLDSLLNLDPMAYEYPKVDPKDENYYMFFSISSYRKKNWRFKNKVFNRSWDDWMDIELKDNKVLVLSKDKGLGFIKIKDKDFKAWKIKGKYKYNSGFRKIYGSHKIKFKRKKGEIPAWFIRDSNGNNLFYVYKKIKNGKFEFKKVK